jgi:hypothetical protein
MSGWGARDSRGFGKGREEWQGARKMAPTNFTRLRLPGRFSMVSAGSLGPRLFTMCKVRRPACRFEVLGSPGPFGKGRSSDREPEIGFSITTCHSDHNHASPCYQQLAWDLGYSECTKPRGVHVGCGGLRP